MKEFNKIPKGCITEVNKTFNVKFYNLKTKNYEHIGYTLEKEDCFKLYADHQNNFYFNNIEYLPKGISVIKPHQKIKFHLRLKIGLLGWKIFVFENYINCLGAKRSVFESIIDI